MVVLLGIAFLAGVITAVSPCVLPVLPIVLAGGASGGRRRPYAIIAGLVTTFVVSILFATYILAKLGLPEDLLRNVSIALLFVIAATLLVPQVGLLLERALAPLGRRRGTGDLGGGFLLGCALGFAFVPCGGPILAYVSAQSASVNFGFRPVALAIAYALGASVVLLAIAVGGQRVAKPLRARVMQLRAALGGGGRWLNSPPLTTQRLRGKVVLVDFWTYSCINCLRTLPQLEAWDANYRKDGLVIVGVHTPEFAFEHVTSNVAGAVKRLGVRYPVVQDNDYAIWEAYANQYWPAEYLIDRSGHVRHAHFGEGEYDKTEKLIRNLLGVDRGSMTRVRDRTPEGMLTPESYVGYDRADRFVGDRLQAGRPAAYHFPATLPLHDLAFGGLWTVLGERAVAGLGAGLRVHFQASKVYLVLGGHGRVNVLVDGK